VLFEFDAVEAFARSNSVPTMGAIR